MCVLCDGVNDPGIVNHKVTYGEVEQVFKEQALWTEIEMLKGWIRDLKEQVDEIPRLKAEILTLNSMINRILDTLMWDDD